MSNRSGENDVRVTNWLELQERLYEGAWNQPLGRFRSTLAFRGMSAVDDTLATSLERLGRDGARHENHLLRNFRKYAYRRGESVPPADSIWNWIALGQHHGLPTRMLDWTYSPYVALHFATMDTERFDVDAAVWAVDYVRCHELLPSKLREALEHEDADVFIAELLERGGADSLACLDELSAQSGEFMVFLEPPSLDERIVNQLALFSLMSSNRARHDEWLARYPKLYRRIIIPAELKWEVRDKLDQANVTERVLFPGLDGLSRWLKRYYTPRT
jgi:hypothetical protein